MREQSSAIGRAAIAITRFWREIVYLQECLLERPWEQEGELRWQRDLGGPRLVGRGIEAQGVADPAAGDAQSKPAGQRRHTFQ
ncbi:MAG: hypothetical protein J2O48_04805 [Solirubrobacterales bacterium]|nr:hypothetical protein [Solirubrobacterales bacterium]